MNGNGIGVCPDSAARGTVCDGRRGGTRVDWNAIEIKVNQVDESRIMKGNETLCRQLDRLGSMDCDRWFAYSFQGPATATSRIIKVDSVPKGKNKFIDKLTRKSFVDTLLLRLTAARNERWILVNFCLIVSDFFFFFFFQRVEWHPTPPHREMCLVKGKSEVSWLTLMQLKCNLLLFMSCFYCGTAVDALRHLSCC